jgi:hypothetical protein
MKRTALILVVLSLLAFAANGDGQTRRRSGRSRSASAGAGKVAIKCPATLNDITDCPDTGCGPSLDPLLNQAKNVQTVSGDAETMTIKDMQDLPDPVPGYKIGDPRDKLTALGEGKKITVEAWALVARKGSAESCNCKLTAVADTDNHIVLITPSVKTPTLIKNEAQSETAEFTPRVRLDHPNLARAKLQPLITDGGGKLSVRITGQLMFDSEHSLGHHLKRHNNWEVHPVTGLMYCPKKKCTQDSDWKDLEQ